MITRGFPPPESDLASLFFAVGVPADAEKSQVWARRRAATALAIAISTPMPKISVPITLT